MTKWISSYCVAHWHYYVVCTHTCDDRYSFCRRILTIRYHNMYAITLKYDTKKYVNHSSDLCDWEIRFIVNYTVNVTFVVIKIAFAIPRYEQENIRQIFFHFLPHDFRLIFWIKSLMRRLNKLTIAASIDIYNLFRFIFCSKFCTQKQRLSYFKQKHTATTMNTGIYSFLVFLAKCIKYFGLLRCIPFYFQWFDFVRPTNTSIALEIEKSIIPIQFNRCYSLSPTQF